MIERTALRRLLRHGGSAAAWAARDRAAREGLDRAAADREVLAGGDTWATLLQAPLDAAGPAVQTVLDAIARGAAEVAQAQQRETGRRLLSGVPAAAPPRHAIAQALAGAAKPAAPAARQPVSLAEALAGDSAPAVAPARRARAAAADGRAAPVRSRAAGAGAAPTAAAAAALAQWRRRAADAGLADAFESVVRAGSGVAAALLPWALPAAAGPAHAAAPSPVDRIDAVLGRIAAGVGVAARSLADALPAPGSGLFEPLPAPRGIGAITPVIADALAAAPDAGPMLPARSRGGFRGLAELAARAAAGTSGTPPQTQTAADAAAADDPRAATPVTETDDDLADRIARILRRAAVRDGIDLDDVQP